MSTIKGIKVGTTTITASYTEGGVTKTASQNLTVTALSFTVDALSNVVFTGNAQKLEPVVKGYNVNGQNVTLTKGTDYTVAWSSDKDSTTCKAVGTITVTVTGTGNYTGTKTTTYQITNATLTVSAPNQSNVYTGSPQGNAISATSVGSQAVTIKYGTTSGTYNLSSAPQITHVSESKTIYYQVTAPNHATKTGQYLLDITPKEVGLSWSSTTSWVYDGSAHSTSCSATGVVSGDTCNVTLSNNSVGKNVGTQTVTATGLSNGDYKLPTTGLTKSISITQKEVSLNWGTTSWTYDGATHSTTCTAGSLVGSDTCNVTLTNNSVGKNVGSQTVTASSLDNSNYKLPSAKTKTISITQKTVSLNWGDITWTYDGSTHSTTCTAGSLVSGDTCTVTLSGNSITDAGTKTVTATELGNGNYKLPTSGLSKTLTVEKRNVTYTADSQTKTYDGTALSATNTATLTSGSLVSGHNATFSCTGSRTDVGTSTKTLSTVTIKSGTTDVSSNYEITKVNSSIIITAVTVGFTWGTTTWTYDGTAHSTTCTVTGLKGSDTCTATLSGNSITNKGTATVTVTALSNSNYAIPSAKTATLTVNARPVYFKADDQSKTYDGNALTAANTATQTVNNTTYLDLVSGHTASFTCTGSQTNYGSSTKTLSGVTIKSGTTDVSSNYAITKANGTLSVSKKTVSLNWGTLTWTYDGIAHSTTCTAGSLVGSDTCTVTLSGNSITNAGTATVTASALSNTNYALPSANTNTLTINKRLVTYKAVNQTKTYDGALLNADDSIELTSGTLASNQTATGSCTGSIGANVSTGTKTLSSVTIKNSGGTDVTSNYTITKTNGSLSITQRTVSLNWGSTSTWVYDGAEHTMTCTAGNVVSGDSCTVTLKNNKLTNVGNSTAEATGLSNTNYALPSSKTKGISVTPRHIKITADSDSRAFIYDTPLIKDTATAEATNGSRGLASGEHLHSWTCTGSQTYVGSSSNVVSAATIYKGTHNGTESATTSNYEIEYVPGTITITKATPSVTVANVNITFTGNDATTTVNVNAKGTLYWKKNSTATTSSYDGSVNISSVSTNTSFTITGVNENNEDCTLYWLFVPSSSATITTGQTYAANFNNNNGTATVTINPRSISSISASATTVTYNGSSQTASLTISDSGATLTANDYEISGNTQTNAGTHTITFTGKNNYTGTKTISWKINPKAITVTAGSDSKIFDNTALTCDTATSTTLGTGDHLHSWTCTGSQTNYGSSNNVASDAKIYKGTHTGSESDVTDNYTITYAPGTLSVSQREVTLNWGDVTWTYDGATHSTTCTAGNVVSGTTCTVTLEGNSVGANVGTATVTAKSLNNNNYKLPSVNTKTLTISSRAVTYTAINQTKVYDKSKLTAANTANLTSGSLATNQTATITCTGEIGPDVSSGVKTLSDVIIMQGSTNVTSNYTITKVNGTLEITKANGTITYTASNASRICTDAAAAKTNTDAAFALSVSTGATGATGTVSCAISVNSGGVSGWSVTSDGKTVTVPTGTAAGEYSVKLTATSAANTNYKEASQARTITVTIIENKLVELTMSLNTPNGDNKIAFGSSTTPSAVARYTNDQTKTVNATYTTSDSTIAEIS